MAKKKKAQVTPVTPQKTEYQSTHTTPQSPQKNTSSVQSSTQKPLAEPKP